MFFWNSPAFWWSSGCWQFDLSFLCQNASSNQRCLMIAVGWPVFSSCFIRRNRFCKTYLDHAIYKFCNLLLFLCILWWTFISYPLIFKTTLELDMEQKIDSKLGKEYIKAVYCHPACSTYMQSTSCEMLGWMNHMQESRSLGEISTTSDMQMILSLWQKVKRN